MMCAQCAAKAKAALVEVIELPNGCYWGRNPGGCFYGTIYDAEHNQVHYGILQGEMNAIRKAFGVK